MWMSIRLSLVFMLPSTFRFPLPLTPPFPLALPFILSFPFAFPLPFAFAVPFPVESRCALAPTPPLPTRLAGTVVVTGIAHSGTGDGGSNMISTSAFRVEMMMEVRLPRVA